MMRKKKKGPYLQPRSCHLGFNQYFGKGPSFTDTDCHSSPLRSVIRPETLMCCQQMTPLDLPVLLLHQCQNKSLHQLSSLRALHLRARTSFFGRCLWSANHVVWAAVKPACMAAPCPCITVSCACAICLCISTPHARASPHPCVHAPLPGWASNAHGGTEPLQEQGPDPTHLGR